VKLDPKKFPKGSVTNAEKRLLLETIEEAAMVPAERPYFVELGTMKAVTSRMVILALLALERRAYFVTADLNIVRRGKGYAHECWQRLCEPILTDQVDGKFFAEFSWDIAPRFGDPVVWVFVDACHCRECVEKDIAAYAPRIAPGGFILFHDCSPLYAKRNHNDQHVIEPIKDNFKLADRTNEVYEAVSESSVLAAAFDKVAETAPQPVGTKKLFGGTYAYRRHS
jgi:hypothetical protein